MYIDEGKLILNEKLEFESCDEILEKLNEVDEVIIETNDIHPSIFQILFCASKEKKMNIDDSFNQRLFQNIRFDD